MERRIDVVGAVIERDGLILCAQRASGSLAGRWEFPGGKLEPGETPEAALRREIAEELGCLIAVGDPVTTTGWTDDGLAVSLTTFRCAVDEGEPASVDGGHSELRWLPRARLGELDWAPADVESVVLLVAEDRDPLESVVDEPEGVVSEFDHDGAILVAETYGTRRPTFVLVHGIGMGRRVFADFVRLVHPEAGVVAVDLPGYGAAPEPARTPTIERMADHVAAYIRHSGIEAPVIVGHSMGTQVVTEIAARHPDLTDRIVLVAPTVDDTARRPLTQLRRLARDLLRESPKVLYLGGREYLRAGPHLRRKMRAMLAHRPEDAYPRVRAKTLVLRGADDPVCPAPWCRRVARAIPDAVYREVPGRGHETLISDAAAATAIIAAWLAAHA